jgi:hypothetical protein
MDHPELGIFGAKKPSLAMRGFDKPHVSKDLDELYVSKDLGLVRAKEVKLDTRYEKAWLDGGVTVATAWWPHTGEFCPGAAASP